MTSKSPNTNNNPPSNATPSKLPKFLQHKANRDRSKSTSIAEQQQRNNSNTSIAGPSSPTPGTSGGHNAGGSSNPPVIVEPSSSTSKRSLSPPSSPSSSAKMNDIPTRLSGWFTHTFSSSTTDLSLPSLLNNASGAGASSHLSTPAKATSRSALLNVAKHGKGHFDKAMRYILDSDSTPDKCPDPIWLLGVLHKGWENPPPGALLVQDRRSLDTSTSSASSSSASHNYPHHGHSHSHSSGHGKSPSTSSTSSSSKDPGANWPPVFYADFVSRVWVTYRKDFTPIRDARLGDLPLPCSPPDWDDDYLGEMQRSDSGSSSRYSQSQSTNQTHHSQSPSHSSSRSSSLNVVKPSSSPPSSKRWNWPLSLSSSSSNPNTSSGYASDRGYHSHPHFSSSTPSTAGGGGYSTDRGYTSAVEKSSPSSYRSDPRGNSRGSSDRGGGGRFGWGSSAEKGWTSDAGWGCMLRTGQSLLANCLVELMLGRDFRPPHAPPLANPSQSQSSLLQPPPHTSPPPSSFSFTQDLQPPSASPPLTKKQLATYIKILTWFLDTPSPSAPFSVHRLALAGKELGKDVGMWFGPSTAAGGIRQLVHAFPEAGLGVCVASDGVIYQSDVYNASHVGSARSVYGTAKSSKSGKKGRTFDARYGWGDKAVLILLTTRLGIDGVNPVYYETIKTLYTFPQSVGIAGGRPSSSYYFVGSQADNLFYLDPHHARPTVPLRPFPPPYSPPAAGSTTPNAKGVTPTPASSQTITAKRGSAGSIPGGGKFGYDAPSAASSVVADSEWAGASGSGTGTGSGFSGSSAGGGKRKIPFGKSSKVTSPSGSVKASSAPSSSGGGSGFRSKDKTSKRTGSGSEPMDIRELYSSRDSPSISEEGPGPSYPSPSDSQALEEEEQDEEDEDLTAYERHLINSYSMGELRTFHCERVRKMPLSGLDPSMLIGFLVKSEEDWMDLRRRIGEMSKKCKPIFSVQDEPPNWPSDSDDNMGLESISEPDDGAIIALDDEDDEDAGSNDGSDDDARRADRFDEEDEEDDDDADVEFFDTRSASVSISSVSGRGSSSGPPTKKNLKHGSGSPDDNDTEDSEDANGPITPGPNTGATSFAFGDGKDGEPDDIEDDWIDPSVPTPRSESIPPPPPSHSASILRSSSSHSSSGAPISGLPSPSLGSRSKIISPPLHQRSSSSKSSSSASGKKKKSTTGSSGGSSSKLHQQVPVPVPFPVSVEDEEDYERDFEYVRAESASPVSASSSGGFPVLNEDELDGKGLKPGQGQNPNQHSHPSTGGRRPTAVTVTKRNTQGEGAAGTSSTGEKRRGRDGGRTQSGGVKAVFES